MRIFIALCFLVLLMGYWVVSGGSGFVPETWPGSVAQAPAETSPAAIPAAATPSDVQVTRAESPTDPLVAPPPQAGSAEASLSLDPAPLPRVAASTADLAQVAPAPDRLNAAPLDPLDALAEIAPALAVEAPPSVAPPAAPETLVASSATVAPADLRRVTGDRVNLREGPGTSFAVVGKLERDATAEVVELQGGWARVRANGIEGWMSERFLGVSG